VQKKQFSIFFTLCYRNGSIECFFAIEKDLGPLGVNMHITVPTVEQMRSVLYGQDIGLRILNSFFFQNGIKLTPNFLPEVKSTTQITGPNNQKIIF